MNRRVPIVYVAALAVALALPASAGSQRAKPTLTVAATPLTVKFGSASTLAGVLTGKRAGSNVQISQDPFPYGDGFAPLTTTSTAANGSFHVVLHPTVNVNYRIRAGGITKFAGNRVRMAVSLHVGDTTPARGQMVRFSGFVAPKHDGKTVLIQRRNRRGVWAVVARTPATTTATNRSRYSVLVRVTAGGAYRARVATDGDHLTGTSPTVTLTLH